eukprot:158015-Alexandrium_andersonii.AAC.2
MASSTTVSHQRIANPFEGREVDAIPLCLCCLRRVHGPHAPVQSDSDSALSRAGASVVADPALRQGGAG